MSLHFDKVDRTIGPSVSSFSQARRRSPAKVGDQNCHGEEAKPRSHGVVVKKGAIEEIYGGRDLLVGFPNELV